MSIQAAVESPFAADTEEVTIVSVVDEGLPHAQDYYADLLKWEGQRLVANVSKTGISRNLILKSQDGVPIGVFRSLATGGDSEAKVQLLDPNGFFDVPPVVRIRLEVPHASLEGYIQKFASPSFADLPHQKKQFIQEIQKIAILDMLIVNTDRHSGNLLALKGKLVPIDHNLTLLGPHQEGLDMGQPKLSEDPWLLFKDFLPGSFNSPLWLQQRYGFRNFAEAPWTPASLAAIQKLDVTASLQKIQSGFGIDKEQVLLIESLALWLKKASQAGLTPVQTGLYIYEALKFAYGPPSEKQKFEDIIKQLSFEEAFKVAQMAVHAPSRDDDAFRAKILAEMNQILDRDVALIKGKLDPGVRDQYMIDAWLSQFERVDAQQLVGAQWFRMADTDSKTSQRMDYDVLRQVLDKAKELTLQWLVVEKGSVRNGFNEPDEVLRVFSMYAGALYEGKDNLPNYYHLFQEQLKQPEQWFLPGVVYEDSQLNELTSMPLEDGKLAVYLTGAQVKRETEVYEEQLGPEWVHFITEKLMDHNVSVLKDLRDKVNRQKISDEGFDAKIESLKREAVGG